MISSILNAHEIVVRFVFVVALERHVGAARAPDIFVAAHRAAVHLAHANQTNVVQTFVCFQTRLLGANAALCDPERCFVHAYRVHHLALERPQRPAQGAERPRQNAGHPLELSVQIGLVDHQQGLAYVEHLVLHVAPRVDRDAELEIFVDMVRLPEDDLDRDDQPILARVKLVRKDVVRVLQKVLQDPLQSLFVLEEGGRFVHVFHGRFVCLLGETTETEFR